MSAIWLDYKGRGRTRPKEKFKVSIRPELLEEARTLGVNISRACEIGLFDAVETERVRLSKEVTNRLASSDPEIVETENLDVREAAQLDGRCYNPTHLRYRAYFSETDAALLKLPGIYLWEIEHIPAYVGRYTRGNRPMIEYSNNVRKICLGDPYRKSNPDGFREIHRQLHIALHSDRPIRLRILENVSAEQLNEREKYWIRELKPLYNF